MSDLRQVALLIWLGSWFGVLAALVLSINGGYVPECVPHLTGCTSVSATGRHGWGYFVFKAVMLPAAGLGFVYWALCYRWLAQLAGGVNHRLDSAILWLGTVGAVFLILYITFLGSDGDVYQTLRRYGTVVYFGFTYLAHLLLTSRLRTLGVKSVWLTVMVLVGVLMMVEGLGLGIMANLVEDDDVWENLSEWHFCTALTGYYGITWCLWRRTGFSP